MSKLKKTAVFDAKGFSLIELLIYIAILAVLMTVVMQSFTVTLRRSGQQTSITETKIETSIGIDLLRADIEHAGFGLPWRFQGTPVYTEPAPFSNAPNGVPLAFSSDDTPGPAGAPTINNSDYLTIRGTNVVVDAVGLSWGHVGRDAARNIDNLAFSLSADPFAATDNVIVLRPETAPGRYRELMMVGANYITQPTVAALTNYAPPSTPNDPDGEKYLMYGLSANAISRPFNRTDYYISNLNVPAHCAPVTGVLVKADVNQTQVAGANFTILPIMDCVADFQIMYYLDTNGDGGSDTITNANGLNTLSALDIRDQVKSVRYFILSHEGNVDASYVHPNNLISVGEVAADGVTLINVTAGGVAGQVLDLNATVGPTWMNYRWRVDSVAVTPKNIR
ncbi:MAG: prepilin-type N-terminal cleavage/methylation domain-containing protein [Desulforhopalus sp.]|jgi:prepilin-type N-terminal cleavage/methylation domain-containing protein